MLASTRLSRARGQRVARRAAFAVIALLACSAAAFTREQAEYGAWVFRRQCVRCHGADGQGKDDAWRGLRAPELIGRGVLPAEPRAYQQIRRREFRTAEDVFWFVSASMPADQPASLEPEEYWSVIAYILRSNGQQADGNPLSEETAATTTLGPGAPEREGGKASP
jgi:cytochrome c